MVAREVTEGLGKQGRIEERHLGTINGLNLCALVTYVRDLATNAVAHNPVTDAQTTRHELDAIDEVVEGVLEGETDTGSQTG